ncbi:tRNA uridine(34) 5-carboxymethylaminomethyl modification radical SAM/GNAT enzyme Elp3 [Candidatus Woesearchaeota archaeon]|nr:tRNA uridine(34) 5-carboxymethylaminomethyl modification radical SAM/GNAT enzyme Elp3 [Candidatus Woesearchaeota archaeon]
MADSTETATEQAYYQELISLIKESDLSKEQIAKLKVKLCRKHRFPSIPTDIQVLLHAVPVDLPILKHLQTKPVRSISGVAPLAIMSRPANCPHGVCVYCPGGKGSVFGDVPQSYTGKEPSTMRSIRAGFDPYLVVFNRLEQYAVLGHAFDKVNVIIQGGTFPAEDAAYQDEFVRDIFKGMNDFSEMFFHDGVLDVMRFREFFELPGAVGSAERISSIHKKVSELKAKAQRSLQEEQQRNETAAVRCVMLVIETKPDWGFLQHGNRMLEQGCTNVELGVQSVYDDVLQITHRGHTLSDTKRSIRELRDLGFKLTFHYMPGSPTAGFAAISREQDIAGMIELFSNQDYCPDMLKIYPCMVMPGTALQKLYEKGIFMPLTTEEAADRIVEFKRRVPRYCRIMRIQRDIPTSQTTAGVSRTNLRQYVAELARERGVACQCIRCREVRTMHGLGDEQPGQPGITVTEYEASGGKEFFIAAETEQHLYGFCRLRFPSKCLRSEITPASALVRELHVYGPAAAIGSSGGKAGVQHHGWGKRLMQKAEEIAMQHGKDKMLAISGIGAREYFKKLGYEKEGVYMVKKVIACSKAC